MLLKRNQNVIKGGRKTDEEGVGEMIFDKKKKKEETERRTEVI